MRQTAKTIDLIARLDARHAQLAVEAGIPLTRVFGSLATAPPENLSGALAFKERELMRLATRRFSKAMRDGRPVFFVTVCHPAWLCRRGQLAPKLVESVRDWVSRRARLLTAHGQHRMVGAVDVSWNVGRDDIKKFWCVHAHFLIGVDEGDVEEVYAWIRKAFNCPDDKTGRMIGSPLFVELVRDAAGLQRVVSYISGALSLHDHNPRPEYVNQRRERRQRRWVPNGTEDEPLPRVRKLEFTRLMNDLGPQKLWVLSGIRRRGDRFERENSSVVLRRRARSSELSAGHSSPSAETDLAEMKERLKQIADAYFKRKSELAGVRNLQSAVILNQQPTCLQARTDAAPPPPGSGSGRGF